MKHILICGERQVGKSTLVEKLTDGLAIPLYGVITKIMRKREDGFHEIYMFRPSDRERKLTPENHLADCNTVNRTVSPVLFQTMGLQMLHEVRPDGLVILDELGFMESHCTQFCDAVLKVLDGDTPVIACVKAGFEDVEFLNAVKHHQKAELYEITKENRDALYEQLKPVVQKMVEQVQEAGTAQNTPEQLGKDNPVQNLTATEPALKTETAQEESKKQMTTGALIVAAGMSSRMGDFKPMLNIGSITIAQRIIANFHQVGITKIVMVTGFNAIVLERHLSGNNIIFLRNEDYEHTHMFDSVKIGLEYLKDKVDRLLFTPVDVPLFTSMTMESILNSGAKLARPVCDGKPGHPILIDTSLIDIICAYTGDRGLRGAMESCGTEICELFVTDQGTVHDADTPEDYKELLKYHNRQLIRPEVSVSLSKELPFFDEQMATLLTLVGETRSVRTACSRMQISYSTGWNIIRTLESQLTKVLIDRTQGGPHGGQSSLTADGKLLLERYSAYSEEIRKTAAAKFEAYFRDYFNS